MTDDPTNAATGGAYHHGELRATLLRLALAAIASKGTDALSLRALARAAGVSATAPYRHFPSKTCLLAALATQGFELLGKDMDSAMLAMGPAASAGDRFVALGRAYIEFAVSNPVSYKLMFGSVIADFSAYDDLQQAAGASFERLLAALARLPALERSGMSATELAGVVWSGVHGMADLRIGDIGSMPDAAATEPGEAGKPTQAVQSLHDEPERALRMLFGHLLN